MTPPQITTHEIVVLSTVKDLEEMYVVRRRPGHEDARGRRVNGLITCQR